jgi:hypothetical protein
VTAEPEESLSKTWPKTPVRGINVKLVQPVKATRTNPGGFLSRDTFETLARWRVNVIRVSIGVDRDSPWHVRDLKSLPPVPPGEPLTPYKKHLVALQATLDLALEYHIWVVVTAGDLVGRKPARRSGCKKHVGEFEEALTHLWRHVARHFGRHKALLAYDLMNEPPSGALHDDWSKRVVPNLVRAIRDTDGETYIMIEPAGGREGLKSLVPPDDGRVVFSIHFYKPQQFTHQGVKGRPLGVTYPGKIGGTTLSPAVYWNREKLRTSLQAARDFQQKHQVRLFIGEFGAIRWAPGAALWLADAISLFEEYGWDWCNHSYTGWNGWNPTFAPDAPVSNEPDGGQITDRLEVLLKAWGKNQ